MDEAVAVVPRMPWWAWAFPAAAWALLIASLVLGSSGVMVALLAVTLIATVFASVYHAEIIAHKVGEPMGTLVLAVAVTVIEVALVVSIMLNGGIKEAVVARDTVFSAVMLVCNGIVGVCLLVGGMRHFTQGFQIQAASAALAVLAAMTVLTLVLPNFTTSEPGPVFSQSQLIFVGLISLVLYGVFVFVQTVRHRDDFLAVGNDAPEGHTPTGRATAFSAGLLLAALVAVVGLAKALAPVMDDAIANAGAPKAVGGVLIAALVLLPEALSALAAARADRLQTSLNLALGSALASIGLTIPVVAIVSIVFHLPLTLGIGAKEQVLLALTLLVSVITLGTGRTTVLQGIVHLVILAAFLFLAVVP
jgi:Ca2+:H+ antiporter